MANEPTQLAPDRRRAYDSQLSHSLHPTTSRISPSYLPLKHHKNQLHELLTFDRAFHNGRFVQRMRQKAASFPNVQLEQGTVISLVKKNGVVKGVKYRTKASKKLTAYAPRTIMCDGHFSHLRRSVCKLVMVTASEGEEEAVGEKGEGGVFDDRTEEEIDGGDDEEGDDDRRWRSE
ncbi:hypothetical protein Droror1_Dr00018166, partial [Drosera rotundifolia]